MNLLSFALACVSGLVPTPYALPVPSLMAAAAEESVSAFWKDRLPAGYSLPELRALDLAKVAASPKTFADLYGLRDTKTVSVGGADIRIEYYVLSKDLLGLIETLPNAIYVVAGKGRRTLVQGEYLKDNFSFHLRTDKPAALLIANAGGGNCVNCEMSLVVSLEPDSFLRFLGQANEDTKGELCMTEDIWETDPGNWFGHADSPYAAIYLAIKDKGIVPDQARNEANLRDQAGALDAKMHSIPRGDSAASDRQFLNLAMTKFLYYRVAGKSAEGLDILKKDLAARAGEGGTLALSPAGARDPQRTPVAQILSTIEASLGKHPPVTLPPTVQAVHLTQ